MTDRSTGTRRPTTGSRTRRRSGGGRCSRGSSSTATRPCSTPAAAAAGSRGCCCERLPEGRVIGVDGSPSMIEHARETPRPSGDRVELHRLRPARARARPSRSTRSSPTPPSTGSSTTSGSSPACSPRCGPAGVLEAQCGGEGNVAEWKRAIESLEGDERFSAYLRGMPPTYELRLGRRHPRRGSSAPASRSSRRLARGHAPSTPPEPRAFVRVGRPRQAPRAPARRAARRVRRRGARLDAAAAGARVRALNISAQAAVS